MNTLKWWGYRHTSGTVQVKRYHDAEDIKDARASDFVAEIVEPFDAAGRDEALRIVANRTRAPGQSASNDRLAAIVDSGGTDLQPGEAARIAAELLARRAARRDELAPAEQSAAVKAFDTLADLTPGDTIQHVSSGVGYVVTAHHGNKAIAVRTITVSNPSEWIIVRKVDTGA